MTTLTYATVKGKFIATVFDGIDPDTEPDQVAMTGTVVIGASVQLITVGDPDPTTIVMTDMVGTVDQTGVLEFTPTGSSTAQDLKIVASNNPLTNPTNFTYTATFHLQLNGVDVPIPSFAFSAPAGTVVDLAKARTIQATPGVITVQGPKGDPGMVPLGSKASSAQITVITGAKTGDTWVALDTGHVWSWTGTNWVDLGSWVGPKGDPGAPGAPGSPGSPGAPGATPVIITTSATSRAVGTGSRTFTVASGLAFAAGQWVQAVRTSDPTQWMAGYVTSYSGTTLIFTASASQGTGTFTDWTISLAAPYIAIDYTTIYNAIGVIRIEYTGTAWPVLNTELAARGVDSTRYVGDIEWYSVGWPDIAPPPSAVPNGKHAWWEEMPTAAP
jgi:hypothetical protein